MIRENLRILAVDDEQDYCDVLRVILDANGYTVETCNNGQQALQLLEKKPFDIVISDIKMPVMDGFELLKEIKNKEYDADVIMLTAFGTIEKAVETMKAGAYTYVTKGSDPEELLIEIRKVRDVRNMSRANKIMKEKMSGSYMLRSKSPKYNQVLTLAERAASSESNILILGESGSGKEVLASFIHDRSGRSSQNLWSSIVRHFLNLFLSQSFSVMKRVRLQEQHKDVQATSKQLTAALCFWTK